MHAEFLFNEFMTATETEPSALHEVLLKAACKQIHKELEETNYTIECVRLAHRIFGYLGDEGLHKRLALMRAFLNINASKRMEDQFWANWELVDNLALLIQYKAMIDEQKRFLKWAKKHMPPDDWLKVMHDSTQAIGWVQEGQADAWFTIYVELIQCVEPTAANRHSRILYVETATGLLIFHANKHSEAYVEIERFSCIIHEDLLWAEYTNFLVRLMSYRLALSSALGDWLTYEKTVNEAMMVIIREINKYNNTNDSAALEKVCDMAHDTGACLIWEKRYRQAMPLFEYALHNQGTGITHYYYAICVWGRAAGQDRRAASS
ncbi:hypothetical protein [Paenibacillus methanolicus]|uniref:Uncharacterized protein n=1 Tax=Paenibacillus methanolicus TaxID=582686 RepID=A0A5S5CBU3_9BACL|nr:hypothetical protein [Paenibacillus methanolicus]TYP76835.1 hypothetical protein BCM02_103499 [Paenibacillus methanolicus]